MADCCDRIVDFILDYYVHDMFHECMRIYDNLYHRIQKTDHDNDVGVSVIYSGSFVEGMLNRGDMDIMYQQPHFIIAESEAHVPEDFKGGVLLMDQSDCYPGFTKLKLHCDPEYEARKYIYNDECYLHKDEYLKYACKYTMGHEVTAMHGPAILDYTGGIDLVICLSCPYWPTFEQNFRARLRKCGFQSEKLIDDIISKGFHVVCINHPLSRCSNIEFRFSFSVAEKMLVMVWSKQQRKIYFLCKEIFNRYFKAEEDETLSKGLPSYFAKTVIYWLTETEPELFREEYTTLQCLKRVFAVIREYLDNKTFPNYFLTDNYMVNAYTSEQLELLIRRIDTVSADFFGKILTCVNISNLGKNIDLLSSIYSVIKGIGNSETTQEILVSIFEEMEDNFDTQSIVPNKKFISVKRDLCQFYLFDTLSNFMLACQPDGFDNPKIPTTLVKVFETFHEQFDTVYDRVVCRYFEICLQRSLAFFYLIAASKAEESGDSVKLSEAARRLLVASQKVPGIMNDYEITGKVFLGLLYYARNEWSEAAKMLNEALSNHADLIEQFPGSLIALPILLTGNGLKAPAFLRCDIELCELFELRHMHVVFFDPAILATYLMVKIMAGISPFEQIIRESFAKLNRYVEFVYADRKMFNSVIESYHYLFFKLGFVLLSDYKKYEKQPSCDICSTFCKK